MKNVLYLISFLFFPFFLLAQKEWNQIELPISGPTSTIAISDSLICVRTFQVFSEKYYTKKTGSYSWSLIDLPNGIDIIDLKTNGSNFFCLDDNFTFFRTEIGETTWKNISPANLQVLDFLLIGNTIIVITLNATYISYDFGNSWTRPHFTLSTTSFGRSLHFF